MEQQWEKHVSHSQNSDNTQEPRQASGQLTNDEGKAGGREEHRETGKEEPREVPETQQEEDR